MACSVSRLCEALQERLLQVRPPHHNHPAQGQPMVAELVTHTDAHAPSAPVKKTRHEPICCCLPAPNGTRLPVSLGSSVATCSRARPLEFPCREETCSCAKGSRCRWPSCSLTHMTAYPCTDEVACRVPSKSTISTSASAISSEASASDIKASLSSEARLDIDTLLFLGLPGWLVTLM